MRVALVIPAILILILSVSACEPTTTYTPQSYIPSTPTTYQPPTPAAFSVTELTVNPTQIQAGKATSITVRITNTGGTVGEYPLILEIDSVKQAEKTIKISAGKSESISYSATLSVVGNHIITVGKASVTLNVVTYASQQTPTTTPAKTTTPSAPTYTPPASTYQPPTKYSSRELYLQQAESYQQMADSKLASANWESHQATMDMNRANDCLSQLKTMQATRTNSGMMYDYYMDEYKSSMADYNRHMTNYQQYMESYADYQKQAMEYMLKAQREP